MSLYDPKKIEEKWQKYWEERGMYRAEDVSDKPKRYVLDMFPYPSGDGLHVGHVEGYTATDIVSRYFRMRGENVLHPMGWDAFGLPAENYAIQTKTHPKDVVVHNVELFRAQMKRMGFSYDWSREVNTTDPAYYKWTQWIFLQLFKRGLAYEAEVPINFCPSCKTGLANEEVTDGKCERCGTKVDRRKVRQWMLKITDYADRLLADLEDLDWPERIKEMQRNWIGRSEGAEVTFEIKTDTKYRYVLVHGFTGSPEGNFRSWLKRELESRGYEVILPELPNTHEPKEDEQVDALLDQASLDENTVLVGHSLGAVVALKAIEKHNGSIAGLVTVGGFVDPNFADRPRNFGRTFEWKFDGEKIRNRVGFVRILQDINDDSVSGNQARELAAVLQKPIREVMAEEGHFCAAKEPEILHALLPSLRVFTTRTDTLFGATYVVLAPEHPLVEQMLEWGIGNHKEVHEYVEKAKSKSELERIGGDPSTGSGQGKAGVRVEGVVATNPVNNKELSVFVADYVLVHYGTGAIMAVPAHDERDFEFATAYNLPIREVISPDGKTHGKLKEVFIEDGILVNSGDFSGLSSAEAREKIASGLKEGGKAEMRVHYKLRDWVFSRQRFWGEPIPVVHCKECGVVPVPEEELPVLLPDVENYEPTGTGESPLAAMKEWVKTKCPKCKGAAKRETDTMPQWAGSCWYYLRFIDPHNIQVFVDAEKEKDWMPVDIYVGGAEHAVLHLLYARFWHKVLFDGGYVSTSEPFTKLMNQGMVLGPDHRKMSKSRGNVINPDRVIEEYGADTLRLYEMFMGSFEDEKPWDTKSVIGLFRFLNKVYAAREGEVDDDAALRHRMIKKVTEDIEAFKFNTAISAMMEFTNERTKRGGYTNDDLEALTLLIAPFAPHLAEEVWQRLKGNGSTSSPPPGGSVHEQSWPQFDDALAEEETVTIAVQVNGKLRATLEVRRGMSETEVAKLAREQENVQRALANKEPTRAVFVPDKVINFIAE